MAAACHEAVSLMLFSAVDYTHTHAGQIPNWKIQKPKQFLSSPKTIFCCDTVAAAVHSVSLHAIMCGSVDVAGRHSGSVLAAVKLSRSEWPPLWHRLCGPGQDTGLQDWENCFTPPRLPPPDLFFLVCRCMCKTRYCRAILEVLCWLKSISEYLKAQMRTNRC